MMWLLIWISGVSVAADGHWHPADLAPLSQQFMRLNEGAIGPFEDRSRKSNQMAAALDSYEASLDLLGVAVGSPERERLSAMRVQFGREQAQIEAFANTLVADVDETFLSAVDRALAQVEGTAQKCASEIPSGPQVPGMRPRMEPNPECTGDDLNATLAQMLDADAELLANVEEILSLEWPDVTLPSEPQAPIGDAADWTWVWPLFTQGTPNGLRRIEDEDATARLPFQAALENEPTEAELASLREQAKEVDAQTSSSRTALAAPIVAAADKSLLKAKRPTSWCANPPLLGGCNGNDVTTETVGFLLEDKKVAKALSKAGN